MSHYKISQNVQENICATDSFLIKPQVVSKVVGHKFQIKAAKI